MDPQCALTRSKGFKREAREKLDGRNEAVETFSAASGRLKLRQRDSVAAVFEDDLHRHIDVDFVDRATDDVAAEARAVVQIDPCRDVRDVGRETAQRLADDFANDREAKDFTFAADLNPFEFVAGAVAANRPRAEDPGAAVLAFLHHQFARSSAVPKRLIDGSDFGEWFLKYFVLFCHLELLKDSSLAQSFKKLSMRQSKMFTFYHEAHEGREGSEI
jgi:hypothetical protein